MLSSDFEQATKDEMESDWENERPAFIAGEVGEAAIHLILKGEEVSRAAMSEYLEKNAGKLAIQSTKAFCVMRRNWLGKESFEDTARTMRRAVITCCIGWTLAKELFP